jgi:hypothetical protein
MKANIIVNEIDSAEEQCLAEFYDTYDTSSDIEEAERNGTLVFNQPAEEYHLIINSEVYSQATHIAEATHLAPQKVLESALYIGLRKMLPLAA